MSSKSLVLAIDQGTHSSRAVVFDHQGRQTVITSQPVGQQSAAPGRVEQSAPEICISIENAVASVLSKLGDDSVSISGIGLTTQRSSVVAWDRISGAALTPVISWQDRRGHEISQRLPVDQKTIKQTTGLIASSGYAASKMAWLVRNDLEVQAALAEQRLVLGPLAGFLIRWLGVTGRDFIDEGNASRTMLWDIVRRCWNPALLDAFALTESMLPDCLPTCVDYGTTAIGKLHLRAVSGDQMAALHARGEPSANELVVNIGSGAFVLIPVSSPESVPAPLLVGVASSDLKVVQYCAEGTVNGAGLAIDWVERHLEIHDVVASLADYLDSVTEPPLFMNTVGGLGTPWQKSNLKPGFFPEPRNTASAVVAVVESIVFLLQANIELMQVVNPHIDRIRVSGGLSSLDGLCQKLANLSGLVVDRSECVEASARGVAWLAAGRPADWPGTDIGNRFIPLKEDPLIERYKRFTDCIRRYEDQDT